MSATLTKERKKLTAQELERVKQIIDHWLDYAEKVERIECIAGESPSLLDKIITFHGEMPESSNYKPETIGVKVDQVKRVYITHNERMAYEMIMLVPIQLREYLTLWPQVRGKRNPETDKNFCRQDMLKYFCIGEATYKIRTSLAKKLLIAIDKKHNHNIWPSKDKITLRYCKPSQILR